MKTFGCSSSHEKPPGQAMNIKVNSPKRIAVPAIASVLFLGSWLVLYVLASRVVHNWLDGLQVQHEIGSALSQTSRSLVNMITFASEEMRLNIEAASCIYSENANQQQPAGGFDAVRAAKAQTDESLEIFQNLVQDNTVFQYLERDQVEGTLAAIEAIGDVRAKCQEIQSWRDIEPACTIQLTDYEIEAAETSLITSSGCERAWSASVLEPMWDGLVGVGATTREPAGFPPSTYIAPMALYSSVVNVITTLAKWHYKNDFTQAGAAATHVLTVSLRSHLELFEAALRSVLAISSLNPQVMRAAEEGTAEKMGFVWLMNITQLVSIAASDATEVNSTPINIPADWHFRLSNLLQALIGMQRSAHLDYKTIALDVVGAEIEEIDGLLQTVHICTGLCCALLCLSAAYLFRVNKARWTNGHQLLVQTLSLLKPPLRVMHLFLANLQGNLPTSVRDDPKFRQTAHSIAAALESLSSAVSTGLRNSNTILAAEQAMRSHTQTVDLKFEVPALLARYQVLRDVRIETQLFRSIPTQVELDPETLTIVLSGCMSYMLQTAMPQSSINIAVSAVINDLSGGRRCCALRQSDEQPASSGCRLVFALSLGIAAQHGKPYRLLSSSAKTSVKLQEAQPSLKYLAGLVQRSLDGKMGAVVDVALSSAPVIGVWFSVTAHGALPTAEPGFDIAVINSSVRSGTAEQGLSVVAEEATGDGPADASIVPMDEIVLLCHSEQQRTAWKSHCEGQFSVVDVPCNTPASFPIKWREYRHLLADVKAILLSVDSMDLEHAKQAVAAARASGWLPSIVGVVQGGRIAKEHKLPGMTGVIQLKNINRQLDWFIDSVRRVSARTIRTSAPNSSSGHNTSSSGSHEPASTAESSSANHSSASSLTD